MVLDFTPGADTFIDVYKRQTFAGTVNVDQAITESLNAPVAQLINQMSPLVSYQFLTQNLHITSLSEEDSYKDVYKRQRLMRALP